MLEEPRLANLTIDEALSLLRQLEGEFARDYSTRCWNHIFLVFFCGFIPVLSIFVLPQLYRESDWLWCVAIVLMNFFCAWFGYLGWRSKNHRYVFSENRVSSVGRRTLWVLELDHVSSIQQTASGRTPIWTLQTPKRSRGIVLYSSIRDELTAKRLSELKMEP